MEIDLEDTVVNAPGHDYQPVEGSAIVATCSEEGKEADRKCTRCGEVIPGNPVQTVAHVPSDSKVKENETTATCTAAGTYDNVTYCSVCGAELSREKETVPALGHSWDKGEMTMEPGCNTDGIRTFTCQRDDCDATMTEPIEKTGHIPYWVDEVVTEPACDTDGYHWHMQRCSVCDEALDRQMVKDEAFGHNLSKVEAKEAGCTEDGNIEYWICDQGDHACGSCFLDDEGKNVITKEKTVIKATDHDWGEWLPVKAPTKDEDGLEERVCGNDSNHKEQRAIPKKTDPDGKPGNEAGTGSDSSYDGGAQPTPQPEPQQSSLGEDGTAFSKGADAAALDAAIEAMYSDLDPKGTSYAPLRLRLKKVTASSIKVVWKKVPGAKKYVVYANACGKKNKLKKVKTTSAGSYTLKKVNRKKLKKGTYYKVMVVALDESNKVVTSSKMVYVATKGGKNGNYTRVTTKKKAKAVSVKTGKTYRLKAKTTAPVDGLKVKKYRGIKFETSNPAVATVSAKGVIRAKKKGTCYVYAYAQSGVSVRIRFTVS